MRFCDNHYLLVPIDLFILNTKLKCSVGGRHRKKYEKHSANSDCYIIHQGFFFFFTQCLQRHSNMPIYTREKRKQNEKCRL